MGMQLEINDSLFVEPESLEWQDEASCLNYDLLVREEERVNPFFSSSRDSIIEAIIICKDCPVRIDCLRWALSFERMYEWRLLEDIQTIYGGFTSSERRRIFKKLHLMKGRGMAQRAMEQPEH